MDFLRGLNARGLDGVKLLIPDAHTGLKGTISRGQHTIAATAVRRAFERPDRRHAGETWQRLADPLRPRWRKLGALMDASEHDVLANSPFPCQQRIKPHSTHPIECLNNKAPRRRDGHLPDEASIMRLIGAVMFEGFAQIDKEKIDPSLSMRTTAA